MASVHSQLKTDTTTMLRHIGLGPRGFRVTVLLTLASVGCIASLVAAQAASREAVLPALIRAELGRIYPGWRFAAVAPDLKAQLASEQRPDWITGDFDADGRRDYAVQILHPASPAGTQHVLAFLRRGSGYWRLVVQSFPRSSGFYLALARRGERVTDLDADLNGDSTFVLGSDGIHVLFAQEAGSTCVYERRRFRCVVSSD